MIEEDDRQEVKDFNSLLREFLEDNIKLIAVGMDTVEYKLPVVDDFVLMICVSDIDDNDGHYASYSGSSAGYKVIGLLQLGLERFLRNQ